VASDASNEHYIAIDFGSSHISVSVGAGTRDPLSTVKAPINFFTPKEGPRTGLEFDPATTLELISTTVQSAIGAADVLPSEIKGIGVTSQRQGLVLLNLDGQPIYAGPNRDFRATTEGTEIDVNALVNIWELTGHGPGIRTAWARLKWFADNKPEIYDRTRTMCSIADWIILELTAELLLEETLAVEAGLGLITSGDPANALAAAFNLADIQIPVTCPPGTVVGNLKNNFATSLGLPTKTPVVACGPDAQSGLAGLGSQLPNSVGILSGWSTTCQRVTERPVFDDTRAMWTGRHVIENRWVLDGNAGDTGSTYQWLLSLLYGSLDNVEVMKAIDEPLGHIEPGSNAVTSFLGPSLVHNSNDIEKTGGFLFPIPVSSNPPDRFDIARSALDSFAFAIRYNIERLNSFRGPALNIAVGGGMIKTETFRDILVNVLDCEVGIAESGETTSLGTLSQVAASVGKGPSLAEYTAIRATELVKYEPNTTHAAIYDELYSEWRHKERLIDNLDI
jgi:sugar (pentulose or hexulose) kinase